MKNIQKQELFVLIVMKKFKVTYIPTYDHDDICSCWVEASDKEDAKREARSEYWDIYEIISCCEIN